MSNLTTKLLKIGPNWRFGVIIAAAVFGLDRLHKWWMLDVFAIASKGKVTVTPFLDLVMVWNRGISYGLLPQESTLGRNLLLAVILGVVVYLTGWMLRTGDRLVSAALGLIVGGAISNAVDRYVYGAVADFFSLHAFGFYWYVFNLADMAIVAGVLLLLYDSVIRRRDHDAGAGKPK